MYGAWVTESIERPEGAIPTPIDSPEPEAPDGVGSGVQIGEPLPVGAYENGPPPGELKRIPGLPKPADEVDEELAGEHQRYIDNDYTSPERVRPDQATVLDARSGAMVMTYDGRGVREGLLRQVAIAAEAERIAVRNWAAAVREREENRDEFLAARVLREEAEEALFTLGLDREGDRETVEPTPEPAAIPDDKIV